MKTTFLFPALLLLIGTAHGQVLTRGTVSGQVGTTAGKPLEFTTMMLLKASDSTMAKGSISDATGKYAFENVGAGRYLVVAQQIGYRKTYSAPFAVDEAHPGVWDGPEIATTVSFICGFIVLGIGLLRLGWIVEFIPAPAVSGFMTGSAINIVAGQVPGLMGITGFE